MTADAPAPDVLDVVAAPDNRECKLWRPQESGEMAQCGREADVLFVYDSKLDDSATKPANAIACQLCAPTDGIRDLSSSGGDDR